MEGIEKHLYIEFRYGKCHNGDSMIFESCWKNKLWEEHGIMNNMDDYTDVVYNVISEVCKKWNKVREDSVKITLTEDNFPFETFFDTITIPIEIHFIPKANGCRFQGGYVPKKSGWQENSYHVELGNMVFEGTEKTILLRIRQAIAHELIHAYEDYCRKRIRKTKSGYHQSGDDLYKVSKENGSFVLNDLLNNADDKDWVIRELYETFYFLDSTERNAYIAEMKDELKEFISDVYDSKDAYEAIRKTSTYKKIREIESYYLTLQGIDKSNEEEVKNSILKAYYQFDSKDKTITDFHKLIILIGKKLNRFNRQFNKQVSKMVYDLFTKYGVKTLDSGIWRT